MMPLLSSLISPNQSSLVHINHHSMNCNAHKRQRNDQASHEWENLAGISSNSDREQFICAIVKIRMFFFLKIQTGQTKYENKLFHNRQSSLRYLYSSRPSVSQFSPAVLFSTFDTTLKNDFNYLTKDLKLSVMMTGIFCSIGFVN